MPKDPKGRKRPADVVKNAVHVMKIATGEIQEPIASTKNLAAIELGKRGGLARVQNTTKSRRSAIARKAARARWRKT